MTVRDTDVLPSTVPRDQTAVRHDLSCPGTVRVIDLSSDAVIVLANLMSERSSLSVFQICAVRSLDALTFPCTIISTAMLVPMMEISARPTVAPIREPITVKPACLLAQGG